MRHFESPLAVRDEIENTSAAPVRNAKDGWIKSFKEQPTHGTCAE